MADSQVATSKEEVETCYTSDGLVKGYVCPNCHGEVNLDHIDDIKTKWFKCKKCGTQSTKLKSLKRKNWEEELKDKCVDCEFYRSAKCPSEDVNVNTKAEDVACDRFQPKLSWNKNTNLDCEKENQTTTLARIAFQKNIRFFRDQQNTPYVGVLQNDILLSIPINSRKFRAWLSNLMYNSEVRIPSNEALTSVINLFTGIAAFRGQKYKLYNRVAPAPDGIWVDMADTRNKTIKVTKEGWKIVDNPPIIFKHYSHQQPMAIPLKGGDPWKLLDFINLDSSESKLLLLVVAITYMIPEIPHVVLMVHGIQGSGKTFLFKLLRKIVDPSAIDVLSIARKERELVQQLDHHWCAFYDNLTKLPTWISDALCRAATGTGFSKRELYTNDDDIIYSYKRCVGLSGINIAATRGDLLDRGLPVNLRAIPYAKRREEKELLAKFEKHRPEILGGFLDALAKAIKIYPTLKLKGLFRMADFTRWGCAISEALGASTDEFLRAYKAKVNLTVIEAAQASPVATTIQDWVQGKHEQGLLPLQITPTNLYKELRVHAKEQLKINVHTRDFPKSPNALTRQINELIPSLRQLGMIINPQRTSNTRYILINVVTTVTSSLDSDCDGNDDVFCNSSTEKATTCWVCHKLLPRDLSGCTPIEGKQCHISCANRLRENQRTKEAEM